MRTRAALALALAAGACAPTVKPPAPPTVAAPPPVALVPPPSAPDWRDLPVTPGTWRYAATADGSAARFGKAPDRTVLEIRCDRAGRQVVLTLIGQPGGGLTIRTSYAEHPIFFRAEMKEVQSTFAANDRLLDEIAFSRGRFTVGVPNGPTLILPAWAEPARVIEDCRAGPIEKPLPKAPQ